MNGSIRLAGSSYANSGRIEVCVNNTWGLICPDHWDNNDVAVICRQLGYISSGKFVAIRSVATLYYRGSVRSVGVACIEALLKHSSIIYCIAGNF